MHAGALNHRKMVRNSTASCTLRRLCRTCCSTYADTDMKLVNFLFMLATFRKPYVRACTRCMFSHFLVPSDLLLVVCHGHLLSSQQHLCQRIGVDVLRLPGVGVRPGVRHVDGQNVQEAPLLVELAHDVVDELLARRLRGALEVGHLQGERMDMLFV